VARQVNRRTQGWTNAFHYAVETLGLAIGRGLPESELLKPISYALYSTYPTDPPQMAIAAQICRKI
jgi:hypothetical protein